SSPGCISKLRELKVCGEHEDFFCLCEFFQLRSEERLDDPISQTIFARNSGGLAIFAAIRRASSRSVHRRKKARPMAGLFREFQVFSNPPFICRIGASKRRSVTKD